jgi:prohibitin 2
MGTIALWLLGAAVMIVASVVLKIHHKGLEETRGGQVYRREPDEELVIPMRILRWAGFALIVIVTFMSSYTQINYGHRGIQTTFGNMNMTALPEGWNWINPLSSVREENVQIQIHKGKFTAETLDTQSMTIEVIYNHQPMPDRLCELVKTTSGGAYNDVLIPPVIQEAVKAEIAKHKISEITQRRHEIKTAIEDTVVGQLMARGIKISGMGVSDIDFSDQYDQAIEAKQVAEQKALEMKNHLDKTKTEALMAEASARGKANARIEDARGEAESEITRANAKAQVLEIEGAAQAAYNSKVNQSLTPMLIQQRYLERWNGALPTFSAGGDNAPNFLINLPVPAK